MNSKKIAALLMIFIPILWAPTFEMTNLLLQKLGPSTIIFIRFFISAIVLFFVRGLSKNKEKIKKEDYKLFLGISMCSIMHYLLSNISNTNLSSTELMAISSFQDLLNLVFASLILNIVITPRTSFCVGVSSIGAVFTMQINPLHESGVSSYLFMIMAMVFWVLYCIFMIRVLSKYSVINTIYWQCIIISIILFPSIFIENNSFQELTKTDVSNLMYLSIACISLCFIINAFSLKRIGPVAVSMFMNTGPIMTTFINMYVLKQQISLFNLIGIIMISTGTFIMLYDILKVKDLKVKEKSLINE